MGCEVTSVGFVPLTDSGNSPHEGIPLGLYQDGSNEIPSAHLAAGLQIASEIKPRKSNGNPNPNGRIGLVSIGFSNTRREFAAFEAQGPTPNPKVTLVNGAQMGMASQQWADETNVCWSRLDIAVASAGLTNAQVQAAWVKLCTAEPTGGWPTATDELQADIETTMRLLAARFVNLKIAYLSSRVYGGYAVGTGNPEPYAYDGAFAVRSLIKRQIDGLLPFSGPARVAPWIAWGPYLWADGLVPRSDDLIWECADFDPDGLHLSVSGEAKVADMLRSFLTTHETAVSWFVGS